MSTTRQYIRRSRNKSEKLIELQPGSSLSVPKLCEKAVVSYQSFMGWYKKFALPEVRSNDFPKFDRMVLASSAIHQVLTLNTFQLMVISSQFTCLFFLACFVASCMWYGVGFFINELDLRMANQPVNDRYYARCIAEHLSPFAEPFVRRNDDLVWFDLTYL